MKTNRLLFLILIVIAPGYCQLLNTLASDTNEIENVQTKPQPPETKNYRDKGIGFIFGYVTGFGTCFRLWQSNMGYFASANYRKEDDNALLNIGAGILREFSRTKAVKLYWAAEIGFYNKINDRYYYNSRSDDVNLGLGFGMEFPNRMANEIPIRFSLEALYTFFINQKNFMLIPGATIYLTF